MYFVMAFPNFHDPAIPSPLRRLLHIFPLNPLPAVTKCQQSPPRAGPSNLDIALSLGSPPITISNGNRQSRNPTKKAIFAQSPLGTGTRDDQVRATSLVHLLVPGGQGMGRDGRRVTSYRELGCFCKAPPSLRSLLRASSGKPLWPLLHSRWRSKRSTSSLAYSVQRLQHKSCRLSEICLAQKHLIRNLGDAGNLILRRKTKGGEGEAAEVELSLAMKGRDDADAEHAVRRLASGSNAACGPCDDLDRLESSD